MMSDTQEEGEPATRLGELAEIAEQLAQTVRRHQLSKLVVMNGDAKIEIASGGVATAETPTSAPAAQSQSSLVEPNEPHWEDEDYILAPMIGTFYTAAAPGEPAFAEVGDIVRVGQVVAIIEAMKIMNEITAEQSGRIVEVLVSNGQPVEYGQALFRLAPLAEEGD